MKQRYQSVRIAGLGVSLPGTDVPGRIVTSAEIEERLAPTYKRLKLIEGRLELMTGIRERRWGKPGLKPSDISTDACRNAIRNANIDPKAIGCLIHASVCRDFLEPATAAVVHNALELPADCQIFDLSNACLGWLNGLVTIANMIELGQIEAGIVVSGEDGRALVESTIAQLNANHNLTKKAFKNSFASLTIGSAGIAAVVASDKLATASRRLVGASTSSATEHHHLCQGGAQAGEDTQTHVTMTTDSEAMLHAGVGLAQATWAKTRNMLGWHPNSITRLITHQVGRFHSNLLFRRLELDPRKDFPTVSTLGNVGSASVGATLALAEKEGKLQPGDRALLMGIGSGLVCMMMGLE